MIIVKEKYKLRGWVKFLLIFLLLEFLFIGFLFLASERFENIYRNEVVLND